MKYVLAPANRSYLASFASRHTVLVFDYDGTLAPIVTRREKAQIRSRTRGLLASVARYYPCAIVTGRSVADVRRRLRGVPISCFVGNHGGEWEGISPRSRHTLAKVGAWRARLESELGKAGGVVIEDKGLSLSIHYREAPDRRAAREAVLEAVAQLDAVRLVAGKCVVNVLPANAPHKGIALRQICRMFKAEAAIYVGDDLTDESAFQLSDSLDAMAVRVGASRSSRARYYLRAQRQIDTLLATFLDLRSKAMSRG